MTRAALAITPMTITAARAKVGEWHRHNRPPVGGLFAVGCSEAGEIVGVAIVGRPVARMLQDGRTAEITRVATTGARNACSMLYGACIRAAKALGYERVITYTLASEPGTSLRAAGFIRDGDVVAADTWSRPSRYRADEGKRPTEAKVRWRWER